MYRKMVFSIRIKKQSVHSRQTWITIVFTLLPCWSYGQYAVVEKVQMNLAKPHYISAFASRSGCRDSLLKVPVRPEPKDVAYTIQICTLDIPPGDTILGKTGLLHVLQMGDLYRYLYSGFATLEKARQHLSFVRQFFPQACIREYRNGKLGQVIDMNFNY